MTLSSIKNEIPENIRRGLIAKGEGATWEVAAKLAKTTRYEMQQWRSHPDAEAIARARAQWGITGEPTY